MNFVETSRNRRPSLPAYVFTTLALLFLLGLPRAALAQWATNVNDISNTNTGNVGICTDKPEETLDVASTIRARRGIRFDDGAILTQRSVLASRFNVTPNAGAKPPMGRATSPLQIGGAGTINRLAKWTDNSGALGDSAITETGGLSIFGQATPLFPTAPNHHVAEVIASGVKTPLVLAGGTGGMEVWRDLGGGTGSPAAAGSFGMATPGAASTNDLVFSTFLKGQPWAERLRITNSGAVGVGIASPTAKLDVAGNINTSTQYNIGGNRVFSIAGSNNTFAGSNAGNSNTTGSRNSFFGDRAGATNTTGPNNSFFGQAAGFNNTTGAGNSFFGASAGVNNTTGASNSFFGESVGTANTTGNNNSFFGVHAGVFNTAGSQNAFFGVAAGQQNTTANNNAFFGFRAGGSNSTGASNTFVGTSAGGGNTTGASNSFLGHEAGFFSTTGNSNVFLGWRAGFNNTTGNSNTVIGILAGSNLMAGSNNIYVANNGADESNRIRIGAQGIQTATFIAGIRGAAVVGDAVFVDANGQLGVGVPSSLSFKQDIRNVGNASSKLMQLRPVVFHYRPEYVAGKPMPQYGLIAEEVAKVYPELVGYGVDGKPQTVRYHLLNALLLNEVQKQESHIQTQNQQLQMQAREIAGLEARLRRLEAQGTRRRRSRR